MYLAAKCRIITRSGLPAHMASHATITTDRDLSLHDLRSWRGLKHPLVPIFVSRSLSYDRGVIIVHWRVFGCKIKFLSVLLRNMLRLHAQACLNTAMGLRTGLLNGVHQPMACFRELMTPQLLIFSLVSLLVPVLRY